MCLRSISIMHIITYTASGSESLKGLAWAFVQQRVLSTVLTNFTTP